MWWVTEGWHCVPLPPCLKWLLSVGCLTYFTASATRRNKAHAILSCFVHGCVNSLTPRWTVIDSKVCGHSSWIVLTWKSGIFPHHAHAVVFCLTARQDSSGFYASTIFKYYILGPGIVLGYGVGDGKNLFVDLIMDCHGVLESSMKDVHKKAIN